MFDNSKNFEKKPLSYELSKVKIALTNKKNNIIKPDDNNYIEKIINSPLENNYTHSSTDRHTENNFDALFSEVDLVSLTQQIEQELATKKITEHLKRILSLETAFQNSDTNSFIALITEKIFSHENIENILLQCEINGDLLSIRELQQFIFNDEVKPLLQELTSTKDSLMAILTFVFHKTIKDRFDRRTQYSILMDQFRNSVNDYLNSIDKVQEQPMSLDIKEAVKLMGSRVNENDDSFLGKFKIICVKLSFVLRITMNKAAEYLSTEYTRMILKHKLRNS